MPAAIATVSNVALTDSGGYRALGKATVAVDTGVYSSGGVAIPSGMEISLGIVKLFWAEPALVDASSGGTTHILTVDDANVKFILWDVNLGKQVAHGATLPAGLSFTLRYEGQRRT